MGDVSPVYLVTGAPQSGAVGALVLLIAGAGLGALSGYLTIRFAKPPANLGQPLDEQSYAQKVWGCNTLPPVFPAQAAGSTYSSYFLWDLYPGLDKVPEAENLALKWPPARGSRYRLAAYPFVQTSKEWVPVTVVKSILKMVNKYKDEATPPAWYVSVYDESDWTKDNIFLPDGSGGSTTHMVCRSSAIFQPFKWVEVTRTCYPVKKDSYPLCDDGGQWYYHAPGSGVWYNLGNCLVRYNKIDAAVYCAALMGVLYETQKINPPVTIKTIFGSLNSELLEQKLLSVTPAKLQDYVDAYGKLLDTQGASLLDYDGCVKWDDFWKKAKEHFAKKVSGFLGERSFVKALMKLIKDSRSADDQEDLKLEGFLPFLAFHMKAGEPRTGFLVLTSVLGGILGLLLAVLFLFIKGHLVAPLLLLGAAAAAVWFGWEAGLEAFVNSQGVYMLQKGLDLYKASVEDVIDMCVEPELGASSPEKQQFFSGLPSSWIADLMIEVFGSALGFDVVVMHSQPNKSGTYLVEMVDVTKIKLAFASTPSPSGPSWWPGGTCGTQPIQNFDCENCPYDGAQPSPSRVRGGLCYPSSSPSVRRLRSRGSTGATGPAASPYMTIKWKNETTNVVAADTPWAVQGADYPLSDKEMSVWLNKFGAQPCQCRDGPKAMCIGCEAFLSDQVCNWNLTPPSP